MMVDSNSACLFSHTETLVGAVANHTQIAKIKIGQRGIYPLVVSAIQNAIQKALVSTAPIVEKYYPVG